MPEKNKIISNPLTHLIVVLLFFLIGKIAISGIGYMEDSDEGAYLYISKNYESLKSGDILTWYNSMEQQTRPILETFTRFVQVSINKSIMNFTKPDYSIYDIAMSLGFYNIMISLFILIIFYKLLLNLNFNPSISIIGVILLGVFTNSNIYTRHILPYDSSLFLHLLSLSLLTSKNFNYKKALLSGIFSAIALNIYYGHFMFFFINICVILYLFHSDFKKIKNVFFLFYAPLIILLITLELIMSSVDRSYISFIISSSTTINQGSYSEGFSYIALYFIFVERWYGVLILSLSFLGLFKLFSLQKMHLASFVALIGFVSYFLYGTYVYFFEHMVFYGRILHIYFPFVIISCLIFIQQLNKNVKKFFIPLMLLIASIYYYTVIKDLNSIAYPVNVSIDYKLNSKNVKFTSITELEPLYDIYNINYFNLNNDNNKSYFQSKNYKLVNFCFFYHYPDDFIEKYKKNTVSSNQKVIFSKKHFMSHPAYTFEYCTSAGRKFFIEKAFKIMIIETEE